MSDITLTNGLIDVGGILTETYVRDTRATDEAKQELGLDPSQTYKASIGIANVQEYVTMTAINVSKNDYAFFDLEQFDQALKLESVYIDNANQDQITFEVWRNDGNKLLEQKFTRNKTPIQFPSAPLPPNVVIAVKALTNIDYMQLCFVPCVIIGAQVGEIVTAVEYNNYFENKLSPEGGLSAA